MFKIWRIKSFSKGGIYLPRTKVVDTTLATNKGRIKKIKTYFAVITRKTYSFLLKLWVFFIQMEVVWMIYRPMYKILTGVRRCGKSTILKMIGEKLREENGIPRKRIISYWFDSMEYEDMTAKQMFTELKGKLSPESKTYLFLL